ncbi:MAG: poly-gamma-glutamate biosynthesis protein PgsC [bacterium]
MIIRALGIGIILNYIFMEIIGLSAGGLITAGYLAYFWGQPIRILVTFITAFFCYGLILLLANFIIIYSKRRFMLAVISSFLFSWFISTYLIRFFSFPTDIRVIGYIIPGLIANEMIKQGIIKTILVTIFITSVTRLCLLLII